MAARRDSFVTVHSEGALLPPDFLKRVAEGSKDVPFLSPADYHLQEREKLSEAITRSWNRPLGFCAAFQSASAALKGDAATGLTRDKWLLPSSRSWATAACRQGLRDRRQVLPDLPRLAEHADPVRSATAQVGYGRALRS